MRFVRVCAAVALVASGLCAQTVRGRVEAEATSERLAGGVVAARDSAGHAAASSAITNANGEFAIRFGAPGHYAVSVRRLGYRPVNMSIDVSASDTTVVVRMSPVAFRMATIATKSRGQCRVRPASDSTLWGMWSAAELAMLNARVASGSGDYRFDAELFQRTYEISPAKLSEVSLQDTTIVGGRPWASLPPDSLARNGYVSATESHMSFVAPDLDALLSPSFLDNHCFSVHPGASDESNQVGLDFAPAGYTKTIDIRGTFWLERSTGELRALTFYYDKSPYARSDTLAGGRMEFAHLSTGAWVLTHWSIRTPRPSHRYLRVMADSFPDRFHAERVVKARDPQFSSLTMEVAGGSVRTVRRAGTSSSLLWAAPVSTLTVHVRERTADSTYAPAEGDIVRLRGSTRQATTDKDGDATFPNMLSGDYILEAAGPVQDLLELPPDRRVVTVIPPASVGVEAHVMSEAVAIRAACGGSLGEFEGVLSGKVIRDDLPISDRERVYVASEDGRYKPLEMRADSDGRFRACGVPRGANLMAWVASRGRTRAKARTTIPVTERFAWVLLDFKQTPP